MKSNFVQPQDIVAQNGLKEIVLEFLAKLKKVLERLRRLRKS
jgi:hypothetical protein